MFIHVGFKSIIPLVLEELSLHELQLLLTNVFGRHVLFLIESQNLSGYR